MQAGADLLKGASPAPVPVLVDVAGPVSDSLSVNDEENEPMDVTTLPLTGDGNDADDVSAYLVDAPAKPDGEAPTDNVPGLTPTHAAAGTAVDTTATQNVTQNGKQAQPLKRQKTEKVPAMQQVTNGRAKRIRKPVVAYDPFAEARKPQLGSALPSSRDKAAKEGQQRHVADQAATSADTKPEPAPNPVLQKEATLKHDAQQSKEEAPKKGQQEEAPKKDAQGTASPNPTTVATPRALPRAVVKVDYLNPSYSTAVAVRSCTEVLILNTKSKGASTPNPF